MKLIERGKAMYSLKNKNIIDKMSLEDKVKLCSGADFWNTEEMDEYGIGKISMSDGPHGLRKQEGAGDHLGINDSVPATCFPTACCSSSTWNVDLLEKMGRAIAEEALEYKVDVVLGPGVNIKRNPLCGRNFEYFSEDPYVAGKLGAAWIKGVEGQGVGTSLKHFAGNNQENERLSSDSIIDERTLREIYLAPFEIAVKEGKVDLAFVSANLQVAKPLRMKILRKYHDILISGNRFGELKDDGKEVSLKELVSYPWISLTAETITRRFLNEYFEKNSLTFTPDMELATTDMILPAVRHNLGLGFIPAEFADSELKSGQVFEIKVKEKLPERNIILIYDMEYPQSIAAKEFQKFLKEKEM